MQVFGLGGRPSLLPAEPSCLALKEDCECVSQVSSGKAGLRDAVESIECHSKSGISFAGKGPTEHLGQLDSICFSVG